MILGLGTDIVNIERIEKLIKNFDEKFLERVFTDSENGIANEFNNKRRVCYYAKRFAIKEAFSKAVGTGIGEGVNFKDVEVLNDIKGKPYLKFSKKMQTFLCNTFKKKIEDIKVDISISDDYPFANAIVIISE
jgi:holo-[acyl-carrier protein] synthase